MLGSDDPEAVLYGAMAMRSARGTLAALDIRRRVYIDGSGYRRNSYDFTKLGFPASLYSLAAAHEQEDDRGVENEEEKIETQCQNPMARQS